LHFLTTTNAWSCKFSVVTALRARRALADRKFINSESDLDIIDSPYLSNVPNGLRDAVASGRYEHVLFCDVCKEGPGSNVLSSTITSIKELGILPKSWEFVAAPRIYNPLGNTITFLNEEDIIRAYTNLISM
jgi:hypothetical protein